MLNEIKGSYDMKMRTERNGTGPGPFEFLFYTSIGPLLRNYPVKSGKFRGRICLCERDIMG